jgi:cytochrome b involved in lipid metabolism
VEGRTIHEAFSQMKIHPKRNAHGSKNAAGFSQSRFIELMDANKGADRSVVENTFYSPEEVLQHSSASDCWVVLNEWVYDITQYLDFHPGGKSILLSVAGRDCTAQFNKYHPWVNFDRVIGKLSVGKAAKRVANGKCLG